MSLGQPDLYIAGHKMQTAKTDPRPALAGLNIKWGTDDEYSLPPAATLSGQLLIRGAAPAYLNVGAPVGLVDPITSRCLFAGTLEPLTAAPAEGVAGAMRVSFTAAAPKAELEKARVLDLDWPFGDSAGARRDRLARALPRGWSLGGVEGWPWIATGRQIYQSIEWVTLAERYARGYLQRFHDTSTYIPGAGLKKRIVFTNERAKDPWLPESAPPRGSWRPFDSGSGAAILPPGAIGRDITWEKTPADVITDVQVTSFGGALPTAESQEFEFWMDVYVNNRALQDAYGFRQRRVETAMSSANPTSTAEAIQKIAGYWLNTDTAWRPTALTIPDSRRLDRDPLLNLLAVDSRHMAVVAVPDTAETMAAIRAYVLAGSATWTGKKWTTELTLGRTL